MSTFKVEVYVSQRYSRYPGFCFFQAWLRYGTDPAAAAVADVGCILGPRLLDMLIGVEEVLAARGYHVERGFLAGGAEKMITESCGSS